MDSGCCTSGLKPDAFKFRPTSRAKSPASYEQLLMIIEGIDLPHVRRRKRFDVAFGKT
jgi:hypothetical protein